MSIKTLSSRDVYRNPWMRVREDQIERSNGQTGIYGVVDKDDCAVILPLDRGPDGDHVFLIRQFRYTIQQTCIELPQGGWEMEVADPEELARGELREETGLTAAKMTFLGTMHISYGFANQKQHCFLAEGLEPGEADPDPEEHDLQLLRVTLTEFEAMMRDGRITDVCTIAAWGLYSLHQSRS